MKRVISIILILILCSSASFADSSLTVDVDGKESSIDGGITLIPAREIFEALGATVEWDRYSGEFTVIKDDKEVKINTFSRNMTVNGNKVDLDEEITVVKGRVFVSLEAVKKSMDVEIEMDNKLYVKSEEQLEREYEADERSLYRKYPRLYKAIKKIMEKPFEQSISMNMKITNWKVEDDKYNEDPEEIAKNIESFGVDFKSDSKIDYLNKKFESDTSVSMKQLGFNKEDGVKTIVLDGVVYTKLKKKNVEGVVWTKTELEADKFFSTNDKLMKELVKFKDDIRKSKTKSDTIYTIEFDDGIQFDDLLDYLGEDNAMLTQLRAVDRRDNMKIKDFKLEYIIDNEGNLKNNDFSVVLEASDENFTVEFLITLKGEYKNIGKPLEISIYGDDEKEAKKSIDLKSLQLKKDGKNISIDLEAIIVDEKILVPMQKVAEILEAKASADEVTGEIKVEKDSKYIIMRENRDFATVNGLLEPMPLHIQERNGVRYIPLSFVVRNLGGLAIVDAEKSEINIFTVEAVKKDLEQEQKEFQTKYPKLYKALEKLDNEPYKQKIDFADKVENIKVDDRGDIDKRESYAIESKVDFLSSFDYKGHAYDEIDIKKRIRKSLFEDIAVNRSDSYKSEMIVMDKKMYHKIDGSGDDKVSWQLTDLKNDDRYFQLQSNSMSLFINDIVEEKDKDGTKFTIRIDSDYENKAALKRFIYDRDTIVPHGFPKEDCELKNLEIKYLVDEDGNIKTKETKYLIQGNYNRIQMDFRSESKIEFMEIGKALEIEKPTNIKE